MANINTHVCSTWMCACAHTHINIFTLDEIQIQSVWYSISSNSQWMSSRKVTTNNSKTFIKIIHLKWCRKITMNIRIENINRYVRKSSQTYKIYRDTPMDFTEVLKVKNSEISIGFYQWMEGYNTIYINERKLFS